MSAFLKKGEWFLGLVQKTGRNYKVSKIEGGDPAGYRKYRYGHVYRVPLLLSQELAKRGARFDDGFLIARNDDGSFYIDTEKNPGNGENVWIRKGQL
jgi:hypothetical protein